MGRLEETRFGFFSRATAMAFSSVLAKFSLPASRGPPCLSGVAHHVPLRYPQPSCMVTFWLNPPNNLPTGMGIQPVGQSISSQRPRG